MNLALSEVIIGLAMVGIVAGLGIPIWRLRGYEAEPRVMDLETDVRPDYVPGRVTEFLWTPVGAVVLTVIWLVVVLLAYWPLGWLIAFPMASLIALDNQTHGRDPASGWAIWAVAILGPIVYLPWAILRRRAAPSAG